MSAGGGRGDTGIFAEIGAAFRSGPPKKKGGPEGPPQSKVREGARKARLPCLSYLKKDMMLVITP